MPLAARADSDSCAVTAATAANAKPTRANVSPSASAPVKPRPVATTPSSTTTPSAASAIAATSSAAASGARRLTTPAPTNSARPVSSSARV